MTDLLLPAAAQFVLVVAIGWVIGDVLLHWLFRGRPPEGIGLSERAVASVAGFVIFSVVSMIAHVVTGGAVFGLPGVIPTAAAITLVIGIRRLAWPAGVPWFRLSIAALVLGAIFILPVLRTGPGVRTGDPPWHLGWTQQLLAGEPIPTGPAPEFARNAYPWGYHAVLATTTRLVPGSDPLVAHEALHVLFVFSLPLCAAALARRLDLRAAWPAAASASLVGGFAWIQARGPYFAASPSEAEYGADMVVASPNSVYELFPPIFPRELGLLVLAVAALITIFAAASDDRRLHLSAGVTMGMVGLVSVPMLITAVVWSLIAWFAAPRDIRLRLAGAMLPAGLLVFGLWAGPVLADYVRFGGFVDVTPRLGTEWPVGEALWAWGLLLPFAVGGIVVSARLQTPPARLVIGFACATAGMLAVAVARGEFDWTLFGNPTALHQGRFWPPARLLGAVLAGVALLRAGLWLGERSRHAAVGGAILLLGAGTPSLVYSSLELTEVLERNAKGFVYGADDYRPDSFVRRAADHLGPGDVVSVQDSNALSFSLFQFSGVRLAEYEHPGLDRNHMRIRFRDLAEAWDRQMAAGGFVSHYDVVPHHEVPPGTEVLESGVFRGERWALIPAAG